MVELLIANSTSLITKKSWQNQFCTYQLQQLDNQESIHLNEFNHVKL